MSIFDSPSSIRARCPQCRRALRTCVCALARAVPHAVQVLILMHPMEVHEAKGTGHLLHLCLPHSRLLVGERFDPVQLQQALQGSWGEAGNALPRHSLLLYPETTQQDAALGLAAAAPPPAPCAPQRLRLVVIDGTWRKSRKMLYANPALQALPRLALKDVPAGRYAIRKAHLPGQLSTFEATALALAQLQGWAGEAPEHAQLQSVFSAFIARQAALQDENRNR
ncbi:DTW domain-containing protein [Comamonas phosphati]|nr:DTW domain-containing protein [Comamonas phosphati]